MGERLWVWSAFEVMGSRLTVGLVVVVVVVVVVVLQGTPVRRAGGAAA